MRVFVIVLLCLCGSASAQSIVTSSDRTSFVVSSYVGHVEYQAPVTEKPKPVNIELPPSTSTIMPEWDHENAVSTCEPVIAIAKPVKPMPVVRQAMNHNEMVALHNRLHGGGSWTWPGNLEKHLQQVHGVSTVKSVTAKVALNKPAAVRVTQQSNCPNGVCPTQSRATAQRRGLLRWRR